MRKLIIYSFSAMALLTASCSKNAYDVADPSLEVSLSCLTVKAGEAVTFSLNSSKLDMISFYSGEDGSEFKYRDTARVLPCGDFLYSFSTTIPSSSGPANAPNPATLPLSYSTDFNGVYTKEGFELATWTDISDRFSFAATRGQTSVFSGDAVITDLFPSKDEPVYLCYKYTVSAYESSLNNGRSYWIINNPVVKTTVAGVSTTVYDIYDLDWQVIKGDGYNTIPSNSLPLSPNISGADYLQFRCQFKVGTYDYDKGIDKVEYQFVSGPVYLRDEASFGKSKALAIKSVADPQMTSYTYTYNNVGEYVATFVGINANYNGHKEAVSSVKVKVVEDEGSISGPTYDEWSK